MTSWMFNVFDEKPNTAPLDATTAQQLEENDLDNNRALCPLCGAVRGRDKPDGCRDPQCPTMGDAP